MSDESTGEKNPRWHYHVPFSSDWMRCPACGSGSVSIKQAPRETPRFQSDDRLWLECGSCGEASASTAGDPVDGPWLQDDSGGGILARLRGLVS